MPDEQIATQLDRAEELAAAPDPLAVPEDLAEEQVQETQEETEQLLKIMLGEEEVEVPISELQDAYANRSQYLVNTHQQRQQHEQAMQQVMQQQNEYQQRLGTIQRIMTALAAPEPDLENMDPKDIPAAMKAYKRQRGLLERIQGEMQQNTQRMQQFQQAQQAAMQQRAEQDMQYEAQALLHIFPEWKKPETRQKDIREIGEFLQGNLGFSQDEIMQAGYDHRNVVLFRLAMVGMNAMQASRGAAPQDVATPRLAAPGAAPNAEHQRVDAQLKAAATAPGATADDRIALFRHRHPNVFDPN